MRKLRLLLLLPFLAAPAVRASDIVLALGAVPQEIPPLLAALEDRQEITVEGIPCHTGRIGRQQVVVAITGVGKSNSAMTTSLLIAHFRPKMAFQSGTGGRVRDTVRNGEVIIPTRITFHDAGSFTSKGMVHGNLSKDGVQLATWFGPDGVRANFFYFEPAAAQLEFADRVIATYKPDPVTVDGETYTPAVRRGTIVCGDVSGVSPWKVGDMKEKFAPDLMEMESGAFAQVCQYMKVPWLVVRCGSNVVQEQMRTDYLKYSPLAATRAALFTVELIKNLP
jgi:adenosylhomocysteine nucleosidase/futalosine hydrolase